MPDSSVASDVRSGDPEITPGDPTEPGRPHQLSLSLVGHVPLRGAKLGYHVTGFGGRRVSDPGLSGDEESAVSKTPKGVLDDTPVVFRVVKCIVDDVRG